MSVRQAVLLISCFALPSGCAEPVFTEADEGYTREVSRGSSFSISVPALQAAPRPAPIIEGGYVRLLDRHIEGRPPREVFRFSADGVGEIDIRFSSPIGPEGQLQVDYVIRVRIMTGSPGTQGGVSLPGAKPPNH
jgi:hypothetical protein